MDDATIQPIESLDAAIERIAKPRGSVTRWIRVIMAAMSGLPGIGAFLGGAGAVWGEAEQDRSRLSCPPTI
jgi:hypothetical protein